MFLPPVVRGGTATHGWLIGGDEAKCGYHRLLRWVVGVDGEQSNQRTNLIDRIPEEGSRTSVDPPVQAISEHAWVHPFSFNG